MIKKFGRAEVVIRDLDTGEQVTYTPHDGNVFVQPPTNSNTLSIALFTPYRLDRRRGNEEE